MKKNNQFECFSLRYKLLLIVILIIHFLIVYSVLFQKNSVIWSFHNDTIHRQGRGSDFFAVYHAGVNRNIGLSPYIRGNEKKTPYYYDFRYLPVMAYFGQIMANFSPITAYRLWIFLVELLLFMLVFFIMQNIENVKIRMMTGIILLLSSPYFLEIHMGQFTFVSVGLCILSFISFGGPVVFILSALIKPITVIVIPFIMKYKEYRLTAISAVIVLILVSMPSFLFNSEDWGRFFDVNFNLQGGLDCGNYGFIKLLHLISIDLELEFIDQYWQFFVSYFRLILIGLAFIIVILAKNVNVKLGVSLLLLTHFVTYQHVWEHHMSAVIIIGAFILTIRGLNKWSCYIILFSMVLLSLPTPFYFFDVAKNPLIWNPSINWESYKLYLNLLPKVIPTLTIFVLCVYEIIKTSFSGIKKGIN